MSNSFTDCSPLSQVCIKALTDRLEDKRKFAAAEIEKMTAEFSMSDNFTMINRLIIVISKFCLSSTPNTRKGGLLGLAAVMVGFKNGTAAEPPLEMVEEVVRPILTCFKDPDPRVRYYATESLYNVTKVSGANILPLFDSLFDNMTKIVADSDIGVRGGAETLDRLIKDIVVEQQEFDVQSFIHKLEDYVFTKNPFTRMFIVSWLRLLDSKIDLIDKNFSQLLDGVLNCLFDSTEEIRASTLALLCNSINASNVDRFIHALYEAFRKREAVFSERGTFIVLNLCNVVKPETIYRSFAEILKDEKANAKFAYNMVQKLNQILLTTQPLFGLRSRLINDNDAELFQSLYQAWRHSPIAALTLCLLTTNYRHANEIVVTLSQADVTVDLLAQIDWVVQLLESPVFAPLRMKMLDSSINQYLLQSLYGILMILPQSDAYQRLSNRLDQVHKFMSIQTHIKASSLRGGAK